jgi:hypothetical protein
MGNEMSRSVTPCLAAAALVAAWSPAYAQAAEAQPRALSQPAAGVELFASTDSDKTSVVKLLGRALLSDRDLDRFAGLAIERAWFTPQDQKTRKGERAYLELADRLGDKWLWSARLGTDGKTWLGSANLRASDWSKEFFVEREMVETPRGVDEGIYYTFAGASFDFPASPKDTFNAMAGIQQFTGRNERLHLRASYVHVARPELGLNVQLRGRFFHSTEPNEFDYYSPRTFVQLLPVVQMRRFDSAGWMYLAAAGLGAQHATSSGWQSARFAELRIESPRRVHGFRGFAQVQYSNSSLSGAGDYHYGMTRIGITARF